MVKHVNKLLAFSDEDLAAELKRRGHKVYPRERVRVIDFNIAKPREEWEWHAKYHGPYGAMQKESVVRGLGRRALDEGLVLFEERTEAMWHSLRGSVGLIVPKELKS
jgi:hypothetical protein